jgi:hypothetical protein
MSTHTDTPTPTLTVERQEATRFYGESATVSVLLAAGTRPVDVTIYGARTRFGEMSPAEVNWSAIGSCSPADALLYASAIALAASIAPTLAPPTGEA